MIGKKKKEESKKMAKKNKNKTKWLRQTKR